MRKAIDRFWSWVMHPGVRRWQAERGKAIWYRYPSPGNTDSKTPAKDYRRPFSSSEYNVRFTHLTPQQRESFEETTKFFPEMSAVRKLIVLKYLKPADKDNEEAIQDARKRYQADYKMPVEQFEHQNDLAIPVVRGPDREGFRQAIQATFMASRAVEENGGRMIPRQEKDQNDFIQLESLDLYSDPYFQQNRLDGVESLHKIEHQRANRGYMENMKGQASYWKSIDDSFDNQNIERLQKKIGDEKPLDFRLRNRRVEFEYDKDGNVVDIHEKKQ